MFYRQIIRCNMRHRARCLTSKAPIHLNMSIASIAEGSAFVVIVTSIGCSLYVSNELAKFKEVIELQNELTAAALKWHTELNAASLKSRLESNAALLKYQLKLMPPC